jgi:hypothetical protein
MFEWFEESRLQIEVPEIILHETHQPDVVARFCNADGTSATRSTHRIPTFFAPLVPQAGMPEWKSGCSSRPRSEEPAVWERFVRSAPGGVGKQHRAHLGVAARRFPRSHSEPWRASTSLGLPRIIQAFYERAGDIRGIWNFRVILSAASTSFLNGEVSL